MGEPPLAAAWRRLPRPALWLGLESNGPSWHPSPFHTTSLRVVTTASIDALCIDRRSIGRRSIGRLPGPRGLLLLSLLPRAIQLFLVHLLDSPPLYFSLL